MTAPQAPYAPTSAAAAAANRHRSGTAARLAGITRIARIARIAGPLLLALFTAGAWAQDGPAAAQARSAKRGIAYDIATPADLAALSSGVAWWYNWAPEPHRDLGPPGPAARAMDFVPMMWNEHADAARVEAYLRAHPSVRHLLVLNEPNLVGQANRSPAAAAAIWPVFEAIAARSGVGIVGPAITWGTMPGHEDPVAWLDAFIAAYRAAHGGRAPRIDALAFHWYDYGLDAQLSRLEKYGKPFWVTELANWHDLPGGARIDSVEKQKAQMTEMVAVCERRADVIRYAWFTGRWSPDPHHTSLLAADGVPTELGRHYLGLPAGPARLRAPRRRPRGACRAPAGTAPRRRRAG
jgi:hypothetical protein